jgi:hypothetical protein
MTIAGSNNNIVPNDKRTKAEPQAINPADDINHQLAELDKNRPYLEPYKQDAISISFIKENHDMHWYSDGQASTYGVKFERDAEFLRSKDEVVKVESFHSVSLAGNCNSFNLESQRGVKIKAGLGDVANAYVAGSAGVNVGWLDGSFTGGIGARAAVGAEVGPVYAEAFKEIATNYSSSGYSVGVRIKY